VVARHAQILGGVDQRTVQIKADNVEGEFCHISPCCRQILETATISLYGAAP
jgi:hypothetical protein